LSGSAKSLSMLWLVLTSLVVIVFGVVSAGMWIPAVMMFDAPGSTDNLPAIAFAIYSSSGPLAALIGLVVGWVRVFGGHRGSGLKWMLVVPFLWALGLVGWFTILAAVCDGSFDCSV
jgi:hypothetical protein